jgi:hypothetical protein
MRSAVTPVPFGSGLLREASRSCARRRAPRASHAQDTRRSESSGNRHHRIGFDDTLPALGSLRALRVLLGHRRPVARSSALGANSRTSSGSWVRSTPRCHARCRGLLVLARPCRAHSNDPGPLRRTRRWRQPAPGMPTPGYRRRAQGLSPSPRLHGAMRVPGLFHPGHALGVPALQGFLSSQDRNASRRSRPS